MTIRTNLGIDWPEDAIDRAKLYAAALIVALQRLGYGVEEASDYNHSFRRSILFKGQYLGEILVGTKTRKGCQKGLIFFNWPRRSNAHDIILNEGSGDWNYLEKLTKTVEQLDATLQLILAEVPRWQAEDDAEHQELDEFLMLQQELVDTCAERDAGLKELSEAKAEIERLRQVVIQLAAERDELLRWEKTRGKIISEQEARKETAETVRHAR